jgi:hypothetical protein
MNLKKSIKRNNTKDKAILERHCKSINASLEWFLFHNRLEITMHAPEGFAWASTQEPTLGTETNRADPDHIRQAVSDLLEYSSYGYTKIQGSKTRCEDGDTCECSKCEAADPEISEVYF